MIGNGNICTKRYNMKKILSVIILALAAGMVAKAQDVITTTSGEQIKSKVTEVTPDSVKYKRIDNPNGPVYVINKSDVLSILYENGTEEVYNEPAPVTFNKPAEPEPIVPQPAEPSYREPSNVRYKDIAGYYDTRYYRDMPGDPYIPALSGVASFFIPGLGQCIDGEWGRGVGIFAANVGFGLLELTESSLLFCGGAMYASDYSRYGISNREGLMAVSLGALVLTYAAHIGFNIWNICDAVRVAEVKNLYYRDVRDRRYSFDMHLAPDLAFVPSVGNNFQPVAGLSLKVNF